MTTSAVPHTHTAPAHNQNTPPLPRTSAKPEPHKDAAPAKPAADSHRGKNVDKSA